MSKSFSSRLFHAMPIVGIMRNVQREFVNTIASIYQSSGLTNLEVTMNSTDAAKTINELCNAYGDVLNIGAGTVCSMADLEKALTAGAQFIVTPIINEEVIKTCVIEKIPVLPGAYTPSEIYKAWSLGATVVKVFPASDLKPGYIKEVMAPLNFVRLMPTGGIGLDNFASFLSAGAAAVGIGSHLFPREIIAGKDWGSLKHVYTDFVNRYEKFKKETTKISHS